MIQPSTDLTPAPSTRRGPWIVLVATVAILAAGAFALFGRSGPLGDDPAAANACANLADWIRGDLKDPDTGQPLGKAIAANLLGGQAIQASTPGIRAAVSEDLTKDPAIGAALGGAGPESLRFAELPKLRDACAAAGVKMPAYAEPVS